MRLDCTPPVLLGREGEIDVLRRLLGRDGPHGAVLTVSGEPGIGKSALLAQARGQAAALGYRVLSAAGVDSETHLPFGGLQQVLTPLMADVGALGSRHRTALATALGLADGPRPDLFLIAEAAVRLLAGERRLRPVLVVVDDVQWLDAPSHEILTFVGHRAAPTGLTVLAATRSGHPGPFVNAAFPALDVVGVDDAAAEALLTSHAGDLTAADRRRVRHEARGNPLALLELPVAWGEHPPGHDQPATLSTRLEQAFAGRIRALPGRTRDLLLVAATGSSNDAGEALAATAALRRQPVDATGWTPAVEAGLLVVDGATVAFRHPLVRSGVLQRETVARRQLAHGALSEVLADDPYRRVWHRAQSIVGPDDEVADALAATVPEALGRGAVLSAVTSLERAAELTGSSARRGGRLLQAAEHAFEIGRPDVVDRLVGEAAATDLADLDLVRRDRLREALNDDVRADPVRILSLCAGAARAGAAGDLDLALNLLNLLALRCWWADVGEPARARVLQTLDGLVGADDDPRFVCAVAITEPVLRGVQVTAHLARVDLAAVDDADALRNYGMAAYAVGDCVLATDLFDRSAALLRESGRLGLLTVVLALLFHIRLDLGDWTGSVAASREVDRVAVETGQSLFAFNNVLVQARALALRGEWQAALESIVGAEDEAARLRLNDALCLSYQSRGAALLSAGRPAEAFDCLRRQFDPDGPGYHLRESFAGVALMAEAATDAGQLGCARRMVAVLEQVASTTPSPLLHLNLSYARAVLAAPEQAEGLYRTALAADLARWPWVEARIALDYGRWLLAAGRPDDAEPHLQKAHAVLAAMGAARWADRAAGALAAVAAARR